MTRHLQKIGNSKGLLLNRVMLDHLGVTDEVEVFLDRGRIVITAPRNRQSFDDAKKSTFDQYDSTMKRLADAS